MLPAESHLDPMLDEDMDAGENPDTVYTAKENIKADTTDPSQKAYLNYLNQVMDKDAILHLQSLFAATVCCSGK